MFLEILGGEPGKKKKNGFSRGKLKMFEKIKNDFVRGKLKNLEKYFWKFLPLLDFYFLVDSPSIS